jgi:hypothetical protein
LYSKWLLAKEECMKQIYFIIALFTTLIIGVLSINSGYAFAQEKNETAEIDEVLDNNTSQMANNASLFD